MGMIIYDALERKKIKLKPTRIHRGNNPPSGSRPHLIRKVPLHSLSSALWDMTKPGTQTPHEWCTLSWFGAEFNGFSTCFFFWLGWKLGFIRQQGLWKRGRSWFPPFKTSVTFSWAGATKRLWDFGFPRNFQGLWWPNFPLLTEQMVATNKMVKQSQKKYGKIAAWTSWWTAWITFKKWVGLYKMLRRDARRAPTSYTPVNGLADG